MHYLADGGRVCGRIVYSLPLHVLTKACPAAPACGASARAGRRRRGRSGGFWGWAPDSSLLTQETGLRIGK